MTIESMVKEKLDKVIAPDFSLQIEFELRDAAAAFDLFYEREDLTTHRLVSRNDHFVVAVRVAGELCEINTPEVDIFVSKDGVREPIVEAIVRYLKGKNGRF